MGWLKDFFDPGKNFRETISRQIDEESENIKELSQLLNESLSGQLTSRALVLMARRIIALENSNWPKSKRGK